MSTLKRSHSTIITSGGEFLTAQQQSAKYILTKLPVEVKDKIFDKTPLPFLNDRLDPQCSRNTTRFELACRSNNIAPKNGKNTSWYCEFKRFLSSLKDMCLYEEPGVESLIWNNAKRGFPITGANLCYKDYCAEVLFETAFVRRRIHLTLKRPSNQRRGFDRKTFVLNCECERKDGLIELRFELGNPHDLMMQDHEQFDSYHMCLEVGENVPSLAFDGEDRVYYFERDDIFTSVYRQCFEAPVPELLCKIARPTHVWHVIPANDKLFIPCHDDERYVVVYDLATEQMLKTESPKMFGADSMTAQQNTLVFSINYSKETMLFTCIDGHCTKTEIKSIRRQWFNRNTNLILMRDTKGKTSLQTLSIINDKPVLRFVQHCDEPCVFRRLAEQFFYVLEENRRSIWYQETYGAPLYLMHRDTNQTKFTLHRRQYYSFRSVPQRKRRNTN